MLCTRTWSGCVAIVALLALAADPVHAQSPASTGSAATSSTASVSATVTIPAVPTASATIAPYLASCPAEYELQITACLDTVARDGAVLPCNPDDWWCNCNNWQGILSCYQPCPNMQEQLDIDWNQQNCQGQHGYANLYGGNSTGTYLGSNITTTGSNGYTRSYYSEMPLTSTSTSTAWSWSPTASGSSQQRSPSSASTSHHFAAMPAGLIACSLALVAAANLVLL
ncbi:hypothetical protein EX895_006594 [Sporisorium graminicola]|uniref:Extracellular membrane protein CFEM domain-containing protein n=1 Tax=Sporisorium graminicola TaxID=280036 RepID=A0A4U7KP29_9BASI|nr:hypothetical protein EX895_006594 [Sporisorium graminicola]TKY84692.1 hypothetical protein EX895_006594 [Sporisorium graminicola]